MRIVLHDVPEDTEKNKIYISREYHTQDKVRDMVKAKNIHWISNYQPRVGNPVDLEVKIRHGEEFYQANVEFVSKNEATIHLNASDQGIAAGQFAVFYDGKICLGGGVIE